MLPLGRCSVEKVAQHLGVDRRTVHRHLARRGETFSSLVDLDALEQAVSRYSRFIWDHMGREEGVILPAAQKFLAVEDWAEIDRAFASNSDPRFAGDTDMQYRRLFARIISLTSASAA